MIFLISQRKVFENKKIFTVRSLWYYKIKNFSASKNISVRQKRVLFENRKKVPNPFTLYWEPAVLLYQIGRSAPPPHFSPSCANICQDLGFLSNQISHNPLGYHPSLQYCTYTRGYQASPDRLTQFNGIKYCT